MLLALDGKDQLNAGPRPVCFCVSRSTIIRKILHIKGNFNMYKCFRFVTIYRFCKLTEQSHYAGAVDF